MMRVAVGQPRLVDGDKAANIASVVHLVSSAALRGARVVVLPECPLVGWMSAATADEAEPVPGPFTDLLSGLAAELDIAIVSGVEERDGDALFNSAVLIDSAGTMQLHHRKIDELPMGRTLFETGDRLGVHGLSGTRIGLDICADNWGDHLPASLALMGAAIVTTPCAWAIAPGLEQRNTEWLVGRYRELARRHDIVWVAANSVGRIDHGAWEGRVLHGDSLIVGPDGVIAHGARHQPDLLVADISTKGSHV